MSRPEGLNAARYAETVVARLAQLQEATGADELAITTITHDHTDRVRSYELLAKAWLG